MIEGNVKYVLEDDNTINYNKNFIIIKHDLPIKHLNSINDIVDDVTIPSELDIINLFKYIRYSYDKQSWSMWYEFTNEIDQYLLSLNFSCKNAYFEIKYHYIDDSQSNIKFIEPIIINKIELNINACNNTNNYNNIIRSFSHYEDSMSYIYDKDNTINVYDIGGFDELAKNLSYMINNTFGFETLYFKTLPDMESGDFIFKEWLLYKYIDRKCVKVVTTNNQFPTNMPIFNIEGDSWGDNFDIHIDDKVFKEIFGPLAEPRYKDLIYIPITNRMYSVEGVYFQRGFMNMPLYWVVSLTKYKPNINYIEDNENSKFIDNLVLSEKEQLNEILQKQLDDATNEKQNSSSTTSFDETRESLANGLSIYELDLTYNYVDVMHNYYDLTSVDDIEHPAVIYKYKQQLDDDVSNITYYNLFNIRNDGNLKFLNGLNSSGINITGNYENDAISITISVGNDDYTLNDIILSSNKWYTMFVTISKEYNQVSLFIYDLIEDVTFNNNFNELSLIVKHIWNDNIGIVNIDDYYKLYGSDIFLSNIRLFNRIINEEDHEFIISSYYYRKESELIFIDNCRPQLDAPFIMRKK